MKTCSRCKQEKGVFCFSPSKVSADGLQAWCTPCFKEYNKTRTRPIRTKEDNRVAHLRMLYKLTPEQYDAILQSQGGGCKICGRVPDETKKNFSVDHDHSCCPGRYSCGKCIRGILCNRCNVVLGFIQDDHTIFERMKQYLVDGTVPPMV